MARCQFPNTPTTKESLQVFEWRAPAGSASRPKSKLLYRLRGPIRWYRDSILRIVVNEIYSLYLHISTLLKVPSLRAGVPIAVHLEGFDLVNLGEANNFGHACMSGMRALSKKRWTASILVFQIYSQAFHEGANWAVHNVCTKTDART
jgi:hypothetical protein